VSANIQNSEVNNVQNIIIIQTAITKSSVEQLGPRQMRRQDQVIRRSKHPLLTGHTRRAPFVEIRYTGLPVVKASMEMTI
jgi:hypothetical protein